MSILYVFCHGSLTRNFIFSPAFGVFLLSLCIAIKTTNFEKYCRSNGGKIFFAGDFFIHFNFSGTIFTTLKG